MAAEKLKEDAIRLSERLGKIKHVVLVLSGKGGVGKSTVSVQIAVALVRRGFKVGLLDIDLCGPSIPHMLGVSEQKISQSSQGWVPVFADAAQRLSLMSIGFFLDNHHDPVAWRGPKKNAMIKQFLSDVYWGELDYLIVDTPPGTSDEHMAIVENLREYCPDGAVLVTTPQHVAINDVRKEADFCRKASIPILGVVENMSGYECTNIFSTGGGERLAHDLEVSFLGRVPIDPALTQSLESGTPLLDAVTATSAIFDSIVEPLTRLHAK